VLGTEELMHLPLRLAQAMADATVGTSLLHHHPSPAVVVDEPDYALRTGLAFAAHDDPADGPGRRYAYNVAAPGGAGPAWTGSWWSSTHRPTPRPCAPACCGRWPRTPAARPWW
jgi:hypothetical protein